MSEHAERVRRMLSAADGEAACTEAAGVEVTGVV